MVAQLRNQPAGCDQHSTLGMPKKRKWPVDTTTAEGKRLAKIMALPGYKGAKHDSHVKAWKAQPKALSRSALFDAHVRLWKSDDARMMRWRTRHSAAFRTNQRMRVAIRKAMKQGKAGRRWEQIVGYTSEQLTLHLSRMLPKTTTLSRALADGWHIDHIVPKHLFDCSSDDGVAAAWALTNLRLIPAKANLSKGANRAYLI